MNEKPPAPVFVDEVEKKLKKLSTAERSNARVLYEKYLLGETQKWQEQKLYNWGIIKVGNGQPAEDESDTCDTLEALAIRLGKHYQNADGSNQLSITITKQVISGWLKKKNKVAALNPPPGFIPGVGRRCSLKAWREWFDKFLWNEKKLGSQAGPSPVAPSDDPVALEQQEKIDSIRHRQWERAKEKGEYVHRSIALATSIAAVKRLHLMVKQEDERGHTKLRREKLLEMGFQLELVDQFSAWDKEVMRQCTDRREAEMESAGL